MLCFDALPFRSLFRCSVPKELQIIGKNQNFLKLCFVITYENTPFSLRSPAAMSEEKRLFSQASFVIDILF